jgi:hypothetical protein
LVLVPQLMENELKIVEMDVPRHAVDQFMHVLHSSDESTRISRLAVSLHQTPARRAKRTAEAVAMRA